LDASYKNNQVSAMCLFPPPDPTHSAGIASTKLSPANAPRQAK